jgi:hypothetical protein
VLEQSTASAASADQSQGVLQIDAWIPLPWSAGSSDDSAAPDGPNLGNHVFLPYIGQ